MELLTKASCTDEMNDREKENLQVAYEAACEAMVLLKNDGALPFKTRKVALYGPGAAMTVKGGTGSGEVNERHSVSILEGLEDRGFEVTTRNWINRFAAAYAREENASRKAAKKQINILKINTIMEAMFSSFFLPDGVAISEDDLRLSDTEECIYVLSRQAGEGGDRKVRKGDFQISDGGKENIRFCAEHYRNFVLVINCGSAMDMSFAEEIPGINAILYICQLGCEGGHALADLISGQVVPSGKLADTWARQYGDIPFGCEYSYMNGDLLNEYYKEGIYVGYRYFDSFGITPAYPFGFGMSYTVFDIQSSGISVEGRIVAVKAAVTNVGAVYSGKEVVQLYVSAPNGKLHKEYQSLAAFAKSRSLAPGERQSLDLTFDLGAVASYRESDSAYVLEQGEYLLRLGSSSRNTVVIGVLVVDAELVVSRHRAVCPVQTQLEELTAPARPEEKLAAGLPRIYVDSDAFDTVIHTYDPAGLCPDPRVQKFVGGLKPAEMAEIVVGVGMFGGETRFNLPGSVGNTTSKFWERGLANVALCDGPAGLRIQKRSTVGRNGKVKPVEMAMSIFEAFPNFAKKWMKGDPEKEPVIYQYTTAFPVAAALAQTWNVDLMGRVGTAVYREMKEYGCTYWLAPGINIHRNPLCGRNFEYFSEDPRLTGLMAAALIRGVQQEEGFYVTVKHFACNNQEDNRNHVSSNISERALREIYLRGFELTVRDGGARGIMTSYNKVNGVYAPNSHDLCTKLLRNEWGFDGVVMTDWFSTGGGKGDTALCMWAGNDLIMPGGGSYKKEILKGIRTGKITEDDLYRCCCNVVRSILNSAIQKEYIGQ